MCGFLQRFAAICGVLRHFAVFYSVLRCFAMFCGVLRCFAVFCGVLWCFVAFCGVLRRVGDKCPLQDQIFWGSQTLTPFSGQLKIIMPKWGGSGPVSPLKTCFLVSSRACPQALIGSTLALDWYDVSYLLYPLCYLCPLEMRDFDR